MPQKMQRIMSISNASGYFSTLANRSVESISPGIIFIADKRGCTAIIVRQVAVPFLFRVLHRNLGASQQQVFEMLKCDRQPSDNSRQIQSLAPVKLWS